MGSFGYQWHGTQWSDSGCAGTYNPPGWYAAGSYTPIATSYLNPATGKPYTPAELGGVAGGGTTTPTNPPTGIPTGIEELNAQYNADFNNPPTSWTGTSEEWNKHIQVGYEREMTRLGYGHAGLTPTGGAGTTTTPGTTTPSVSTPTAIAPPAVTPAPAYEISPQQQAWEEQYGGEVSQWLEAGGYGIPEETQAQMIQQQTDVLKAGEAENIRVMRNNMERRGITNSGFVYANEQAIRSNTTVAIANGIRDVQIKSALMKMASFEKAMGAAGQFLGYLSEQSQLKYQPEFATWQAEQLAKMQGWQAQIDLQKMAVNQAYQQQNITLTAQLQGQLNQQQNAFEMQLEQMKIDAANEAAKTEGFWNILGTVLGFGLSFLF